MTCVPKYRWEFLFSRMMSYRIYWRWITICCVCFFRQKELVEQLLTGYFKQDPPKISKWTRDTEFSVLHLTLWVATGKLNRAQKYPNVSRLHSEIVTELIRTAWSGSISKCASDVACYVIWLFKCETRFVLHSSRWFPSYCRLNSRF